MNVFCRSVILFITFCGFNLFSTHQSIDEKKYIIRKATMNDKESMKKLCLRCKMNVEDLDMFIFNKLTQGIACGFAFIIESQNIENKGELLACLMKTRPSKGMYDHSLMPSLFVSDSKYKNENFYYQLTLNILEEIQNHHPDILRVENVLNEASYIENMEMYRSLGFTVEGHQKMIAKHYDGTFKDQYLIVWMNPNYQHIANYDNRYRGMVALSEQDFLETRI